MLIHLVARLLLFRFARRNFVRHIEVFGAPRRASPIYRSLRPQIRMKTHILMSVVALTALGSVSAASAQCCTQQVYRLSYQTVFDEQQVTAFRIENETVYEQRKVTSYKPVYETEMRERRYMVAKPVYETSEREERYMVNKPVFETQLRDCSYNRVRNVMETSEREERFVVNKPVYETSERDEFYTVRKQVLETAFRDECRTVCEPVTTYTTRYADRGGWQEYQVCRPGPIVNQPVCIPGGCVTDPCTGCVTQLPSRVAYRPVQAPSTMVTNRVWRPNIVAEQFPQTTMVQKQVVNKVPVQVCRYVDEQMVRKVPVTTCRMIAEEHVRKVPVTVCRPVVERVENMVPVQVCKMIQEEVVKKIPVTTCRMVNEEHVDQVPVQVCKMVAEEQTIQVPHCVEKRVPVTYTQRIPRCVVMRVPIDPCTGADLVVPTTAVMQAAPAMPSAPTGGETTYQQPYQSGKAPAPTEAEQKGPDGTKSVLTDESKQGESKQGESKKDELNKPGEKAETPFDKEDKKQNEQPTPTPEIKPNESVPAANPMA
jgi:hypothetical protein